MDRYSHTEQMKNNSTFHYQPQRKTTKKTAKAFRPGDRNRKSRVPTRTRRKLTSDVLRCQTLLILDAHEVCFWGVIILFFLARVSCECLPS